MTGTPQRILLIQLQQLGDALLTSCLLEDLREAYPAAQIDFLTRPKGAHLLARNPFASEILSYDADHPVRMLRRIRARRYDLVIDAQSSPRSAQVVLASGARRRIGYAVSGPWKLVYTDRVPRDLDPPYFMVRDRQRLAQQAGVPVKERRLRLYLTEEERVRGRADAEAIGTAPGLPRVAMVLSAGSPQSVWPVERFAALAEALVEDGFAPVVIRTHGDDAAIARCRELTDSIRVADAKDLRRFTSLIAALDLLIGADSGPVKMAAALDVPTVTLYGPTHAKHWHPNTAHAVVVSSPRAQCVGCAHGMRRTASEHTCMLEIEVAAVRAAVHRALGAAGARQHSRGTP